MKKSARGFIAFVALLGILALVNGSIWSKEQHLANGRVVYLQLAPVDPRSLMQGDYMQLRFAVADQIYRALPKANNQRRWGQDVEATDGLVAVTLDDNRVATYLSLHEPNEREQESTKPPDELLLRYRVRNGAVKFATNAFFFQEGHEPVYRSAQYGEFRVDEAGELLLTALYDSELNRLGP